MRTLNCPGSRQIACRTPELSLMVRGKRFQFIGWMHLLLSAQLWITRKASLLHHNWLQRSKVVSLGDGEDIATELCIVSWEIEDAWNKAYLYLLKKILCTLAITKSKKSLKWVVRRRISIATFARSYNSLEALVIKITENLDTLRDFRPLIVKHYLLIHAFLFQFEKKITK